MKTDISMKEEVGSQLLDWMPRIQKIHSFIIADAVGSVGIAKQQKGTLREARSPNDVYGKEEDQKERLLVHSFTSCYQQRLEMLRKPTRQAPMRSLSTLRIVTQEKKGKLLPDLPGCHGEKILSWDGVYMQVANFTLLPPKSQRTSSSLVGNRFRKLQS